MKCPVCGLERLRCPMVEAPLPRDCLKRSMPSVYFAQTLFPRSDKIETIYTGPGVEALAGVIEQIGQIRGRAA